MLKKTLNKLKAIEKAINTKKYRNDLYKLSSLVSEATEELKQYKERYFVNYTSEKEQYHVESYTNHAKRMKNQALAELQELEGELNKPKVNITRCNVLLSRLINSNFHKKETDSFLGDWRSINNKDFKQAYFRV